MNASDRKQIWDLLWVSQEAIAKIKEVMLKYEPEPKEPTAPPIDSDDPLTVEWCDEHLVKVSGCDQMYFIKKTETAYLTADIILKRRGKSWCLSAGSNASFLEVKTPNELRRAMAGMKIEHRVTEGLL